MASYFTRRVKRLTHTWTSMAWISPLRKSVRSVLLYKWTSVSSTATQSTNTSRKSKRLVRLAPKTTTISRTSFGWRAVQESRSSIRHYLWNWSIPRRLACKSNNCTQALKRYVDSKVQSSPVARSRESQSHEHSLKTLRSWYWMRQLQHSMSRVRKSYSRLWIERWRAELRL